MYNFKVKIAELIINIYSEYEYTYSLCKDYYFDSNDYDFIAKANINDIPKLLTNNRIDVAESLAIYKNIVDQMFQYNRILIHAGAIEYKDKAFLFLGPSGSGKSTHIKLLKSVCKDINIINGDKPIIDDCGFVYGTPWAGKERWQKNVKYEIKSIIFVNKDKQNHVKEINKNDSINRLLFQCNLKNDVEKTIEILNKSLSNTSFFDLYCTDTTKAAELSFATIINK